MTLVTELYTCPEPNQCSQRCRLCTSVCCANPFPDLTDSDISTGASGIGRSWRRGAGVPRAVAGRRPSTHPYDLGMTVGTPNHDAGRCQYSPEVIDPGGKSPSAQRLASPLTLVPSVIERVPVCRSGGVVFKSMKVLTDALLKATSLSKVVS